MSRHVRVWQRNNVWHWDSQITKGAGSRKAVTSCNGSITWPGITDLTARKYIAQLLNVELSELEVVHGQ